MKSKIKFTGRVKFEKINENGTRTLLHEDHNLVVTTGDNFGVSRLISNSEYGVLAAIGVGSDDTAPDATDTDLKAVLAYKEFDSAPVRSGTTITMVTTFNPGEGSGTWKEAGLFNAATGTKLMFSRSTFTPRPKDAPDTIAVTWQVTAA